MLKKIHIHLLLIAVLFSCSKKDEIIPVKSAEKSITLFTLNSLSPVVKADIDSVKYTVTVTVPIGTDIRRLSPTITISKLASISPSSGTVQDFTSPIVYTVTAENGTVQTYTVKINIAKSSSKSITSFSFSSLPKVVVTIDSVKKTITATLSERVDLTKLVPTITTSSNATVSPLSAQAQDFTNPVTYTVSAEDGTTQAYLVTINTTFTYKNTAYFVNGSTLFAINLQTGLVNWTYELSTKGSDRRSAPTVRDGVVYVWSADGYFCAIDCNSGNLKWKFITAQSSPYASCPTIAGKVIYFCDEGYSESNIYAVDMNTGVKKWSFNTKWNVITNPTIVDGVLYVGATTSSYSTKIYCIDALTGVNKWEYARIENNLTSNLSVVNGLVYFGLETKVYALNSSNGTVKWTRDLFVNGNFNYAFPIPSSPTIIDGILYITDGEAGNLHSLNAVTGAVNWRNSFGSNSSSSPFVSNGLVYIGRREDNISAIDTKTGIGRWRYTPNDIFPDSSPVIANGVVYIGNSNYTKPKLYAIDALKGILIWSFSPTNKSTIKMSDICIVDANGQVYHSSESGEQQ